MSGSGVTITHNSEEVQRKLREIADRCESAQPALKIIGETLRDSIRENFDAGGRPERWAELKDSTLKRKRSGYILVEQGRAGGLLGSINFQVEETAVYVGTNKKYGAIHQLGNPEGLNNAPPMPARPFLAVQDEDEEEIMAALNDFVITGAT